MQFFRLLLKSTDLSLNFGKKLSTSHFDRSVTVVYHIKRRYVAETTNFGPDPLPRKTYSTLFSFKCMKMLTGGKSLLKIPYAFRKEIPKNPKKSH